MSRYRGYLSLAGAYVRFNLKAQLAYRGGFVSQVAAMFLNNGCWLAFWILFFHRFPVLNGWRREDLVTLWALSASGFGLAHALLGNSWSLPQLIMQGQLDAWMLYPRPLLSHLLLGSSRATAWGDLLFGFVAFALLVHPGLAGWAAFGGSLLAATILFVAVSVFSGSFAFFIGSSAAVAEQYRFAMITFSTYPGALFGGVAKLLLFTLLPAALISDVSVEAVRSVSLKGVATALAGSLAFLALATAVFYRGLRRYESGNLTTLRE